PRQPHRGGPHPDADRQPDDSPPDPDQHTLHHHYSNSAARIASTGAGRDVHVWNDAAPCASSTSQPSTQRSPASRARPTTAVPPAPRTTTRAPAGSRPTAAAAVRTPATSVLDPRRRPAPSRWTVLTAPTSVASASSSSISDITASLCGMVTLAPAKPGPRSRAT